jgi:hypothetical protein
MWILEGRVQIDGHDSLGAYNCYHRKLSLKLTRGKRAEYNSVSLQLAAAHEIKNITLCATLVQIYISNPIS